MRFSRCKFKLGIVCAIHVKIIKFVSDRRDQKLFCRVLRSLAVALNSARPSGDERTSCSVRRGVVPCRHRKSVENCRRVHGLRQSRPERTRAARFPTDGRNVASRRDHGGPSRKDTQRRYVVATAERTLSILIRRVGHAALRAATQVSATAVRALGTACTPTPLCPGLLSPGLFLRNPTCRFRAAVRLARN